MEGPNSRAQGLRGSCAVCSHAGSVSKVWRLRKHLSSARLYKLEAL